METLGEEARTSTTLRSSPLFASDCAYIGLERREEWADDPDFE
jgi:hypothetical protein